MECKWYGLVTANKSLAIILQQISFTMQTDENLPSVDKQTVVQCFNYLYSPASTPEIRKQADQHLIDLQKNPIALLATLLSIFEQQSDPLLSFQALVYFCNVVKRNWGLRRTNKAHSEFQGAKVGIRGKLLLLVANASKVHLSTLFDVLKFIVKIDYPHHYRDFSAFAGQAGRRAYEEGNSVSEVTVLTLKQLREIFLQLSQRKGAINRKLFDQQLRELLNVMGSLSIKFRGIIEGNLAALTSGIVKVSKYSDQMLIYILRAAPVDIQDEQLTPNMMVFLQEKLQYLVSVHTSTQSRELRGLLQKNIKSLIYDLGLLQVSKPLMLSWTLPRLYQVLFYVMLNQQLFTKNAVPRYALIGVRRVLKEFAYYADEQQYAYSLRNKTPPASTVALRQVCHRFYVDSFTEQVVTNLLNFLLQSSYARTAYEGWAEGEEGVERGQEKEAGIEACVVFVVEALLQRFPELTHGLLCSLTVNCLQSNWSNLQEHALKNLLSVVAILPSSCKKGQTGKLSEFPILPILQMIYKTASLKLRFAPIVAGWMDSFSNEQIASLANVLLSFMQQQGRSEGEVSVDSGEVLVGCCQCLNKLMTRRMEAIDLKQIVQRGVPVLMSALGSVQNPDVLWPIVTLVSGVVARGQLQTEVIVRALQGDRLSQLVASDSPTLVQSLCDMFRGFLCAIPRNKPAQPVFHLICVFLGHHLSRFDQPNHEKIFNLWYVAVREYSPLQQCEQQFVQLFESHYRKNLYRKSATLIYILEEYMLASLVPQQLGQFVGIISDCYLQAAGLEKQQRDKLKVAALSFQITLITQYDLQQVNSQRMLQLILGDFCNFDQQQVSATVHNSLLAIVNRYLILYREPFLSYLESMQLGLAAFLEIYFKNMQCITSRTAAKINAIALLSLLNAIDPVLLRPRTPQILQLLIPEVQQFNSTLQHSPRPFTGVVDNSPNLRFAANVLSQRKEEVRKKDGFEGVELGRVFAAEVGKYLERIGVTRAQVLQSLGQHWGQRFSRLL